MDKKLNEIDYLNDNDYMEYKTNVFKKKRILDILSFLLILFGIASIITGLVFKFLSDNFKSTLFYIIACALILLFLIYFSISRVIFTDEYMYNKFKNKKK